MNETHVVITEVEGDLAASLHTSQAEASAEVSRFNERNAEAVDKQEAYAMHHGIVLPLPYRAAPALVTALARLHDAAGDYIETGNNTDRAALGKACDQAFDVLEMAKDGNAPTSHNFTVIWGNIDGDGSKRLDHVTVAEPTRDAIMDAAFKCFCDDLDSAGGNVSDDDREMWRRTAYEGYAILPGHVTDAPGLGWGAGCDLA